MNISKFNSFYYEAAYSASATAYFNQVTSNGGSLTNAEKTYINTFITALGTDFAEFDRLWIHGLSNSVAARTSLANPTSTMITAVNTPTFTANQGYTGNGTTSYLDTNYNPSTNGVKYTRNNNLNGFYGLNATTGSNQLVVACGDAIGFNMNNPNFTNGVNSLCSVNSGVAVFGTQSATTSLNINYRTNSTQVKRSRLGVLIDNITDTSQALSNVNFYICGRNQSGTFLNACNIQVSSSFFGSGAINQATFYTAIQALGTSIGWAI